MPKNKRTAVLDEEEDIEASTKRWIDQFDELSTNENDKKNKRNKQEDPSPSAVPKNKRTAVLDEEEDIEASTKRWINQFNELSTNENDKKNKRNGDKDDGEDPDLEPSVAPRQKRTFWAELPNEVPRYRTNEDFYVPFPSSDATDDEYVVYDIMDLDSRIDPDAIWEDGDYGRPSGPGASDVGVFHEQTAPSDCVGC